MYFAKDKDGTLHKVRDDGTTRPISEDDPCYIEWMALGGVLGEMPVASSPTLAESIAAKLATIRAACDAALNPLAASYPEREVQSWPQQVTEATALESDAAAPAPLIRQMAAMRPSLGDTQDARVIELARRIRQNAADWSAVAGPIIGKRQALEDQVTAIQVAMDAGTMTEADAITAVDAVSSSYEAV